MCNSTDIITIRQGLFCKFNRTRASKLNDFLCIQLLRMVKFNRLMNSLETKAMPAPPSLMKSLMAGFDAISNQTYVILFAISLDIFLWLGPHLKVTQLVESFITQMQAMPELQSPDMAATMKLSSEFWTQVFKEFNLFSLLRTFPIGVPSLMISQPTTASNPFGLPLIYEISSWGVAFGLAFLLLSIGVVLGSLYFLTISQIAVYGEVTWKKLLREWPWATLQIILLTLAAFLLILAFLIGIKKASINGLGRRCK